MESTHGQLCTRLTDRLSSNNTNRLSNLYRLTCCHVGAVTFCADTDFTFTGKNCTDLNLINCSALCVYTLSHDSGCTFWCNHVICFYKHFTVFILDRLTGESSCNTLLKAFDLLFAVHKAFDIHTGDLVSCLAAVCLSNDQLLGYVNHSSGQVTGVGCTKSCIGKTFTRSVRRHEVLQYVKTFTEV